MNSCQAGSSPNRKTSRPKTCPMAAHVAQPSMTTPKGIVFDAGQEPYSPDVGAGVPPYSVCLLTVGSRLCRRDTHGIVRNTLVILVVILVDFG